MTTDIPELELEELELEQLLRDADDLPRLPPALKRRTMARAARQRTADQWMQLVLSMSSALVLAFGLLLSTAEPASFRERWMSGMQENPFPPDVMRTTAGLRETPPHQIRPAMEWALVEDSHRLREYQRGIIHGVF